MTADENFRKHRRHGLLAGQLSSRVPGPEGGFPGGEQSTAPSSPAGHGGTAPRLSPGGRAAPTPRGSLLRAAALEPGGGAWESRPPSQRTDGEPGRGSPRPDLAAVPAPRGSAGSPPGAGAAGGRAKGHPPHACEGGGGASVEGRRSGAHPRDGREGLRGAPTLGGGRGRTCGAGRRGRGCRRCPALPSPPRAGGRRSGASELVLAPALTCAARGAAAIAGAPPPPPLPAGRSAPYLEEGTDLILLQVGLDPGLLVRRHEELQRRGLELLSPSGGCSPSSCSRLAPPPPKGCHSGSGGRRCEGAAARSPRDGANSGGRGVAGCRPPASVGAGRRRRAVSPQGAAGGRCLERSMVQGGEELQRRPPSPRRSAPCVCLSVRLSVCVRASASAWQRLGYGNSRGWSCRPGDSAAPEANGRGLLSAPRPLAPVDARAPAHERRERGKGEEAGGRRGLLCLLPSAAAAPRPSRGRASPPAEPSGRSPAALPGRRRLYRGPHLAPLPRAGGERRGPPGLRGLTGTRKLQLMEGRGEGNESLGQRGMGVQELQPALFLNFCLNYF